MPTRSADAVADEIDRACAEERAPDALLARVVAVLATAIPIDGACWHVTDPATGAFMTIGVAGDVYGTFETAMELELGAADVLKYAELGQGGRTVGVLSAETGGALERSARFRELMRPDGHGDELRAAFADGFGTWGSVGLFRGRDRAWFETEEAALVASVSPAVAGGLRRTHAITPPAAGTADAVGVCLLGPGTVVEAVDDTARALLAAIGEDAMARDDAPVPAAVHLVARRAAASGTARARVRAADGRWLLLDASRLGEGRIALVVRVAPPPTVEDVTLAALGLSPREREVAGLLKAGRTTEEIAAALFISPHTVKDHVKAVFTKTGVRSRQQLVARLAGAA